MYLIFDVETTGLPKNWKAPMTDLNNWPRVIQIAWLVVAHDQTVIDERKYLIKPHGWEVPMQKFWIDNGYSTAKCEAEGIPMWDALQFFIEAHDQCQFLISHNMSYDYNVVGAEMLRYRMRAKERLVRICTKESGTDFCDLPRVYGKPKWPKLAELHQKLFGEGFDDAHDALADVKATSRCFFGLKERGIIKVEG